MEKQEVNGLGVAGLLFGVFSLLFSALVFTVPLFGGLSITFSLLSRGGKRMNTIAMVGIVLTIVSAVVALAAAAVMIIYMGDILSLIGDLSI